MWYTPCFSLFKFFFSLSYFPWWMSLAFLLFFSLLFDVWVCWVLFLCYRSWSFCFTALVLLQLLQQRKVSSAKWLDYQSMTGLPVINFCIKLILFFSYLGFLFPLCSFAFAVRPCLAPWTVLISYIFNSISHLHVVLHTSLLPFQLWMFNIQPLGTRAGFGFLPLSP